MTAGSSVIAPLGTGARDGLWHRLAGRLLSPERRLLHHAAPPRELLLAQYGAVEIRRTAAAVVACTTAKGESDAALHTAAQRLALYRDGDNRERCPMRIARPVVQRPCAPGVWVTQAELAGVDAATGAPVPRSGKVRIIAQPSETLAVIRVRGRAGQGGLARGEAAILAALADTAWISCGTVTLRLHACAVPLPWWGWFEVALPVTDSQFG